MFHSKNLELIKLIKEWRLFSKRTFVRQRLTGRAVRRATAAGKWRDRGGSLGRWGPARRPKSTRLRSPRGDTAGAPGEDRAAAGSGGRCPLGRPGAVWASAGQPGGEAGDACASVRPYVHRPPLPCARLARLLLGAALGKSGPA